MAPVIRTDLTLGEPRSDEQSRPNKPSRQPAAPFHILVLGGLRGSAAPAEPDVAKRRPLQLDRDNLEEVFARLGVEVHMPVCGSTVRLGFLDDFHPDALLERLPPFQALLDLRRRLQNPATFEAAAREIGATLSSTAGSSAPTSSNGLLDQLLTNTQSTSQSDSAQLVNDLVRRIVAPYAQAAPSRQSAELVAAVENSMADLLRSLLHEPEFAKLEAAWRGIEFLMDQIETGPRLKIHLLDLSEDEFRQDLDRSDDFEGMGLYSLLKRHFGPDTDQPLGLVVSDYRFSARVDDAVLLTKIGCLMEHFNAYFVAAGDPACAGCGNPEDLADTSDWRDSRSEDEIESWEAFRSLPEAARIALGVPSVLRRMPYGAHSSSIDTFDFEEISDAIAHRPYCWGSAAPLLAVAVTRCIAEGGMPNKLVKFTRMPLDLFRLDGETEVTPPTGYYLPDSSVTRLQRAGLTVVQSVRNEDAVLIDGIRSCAADGSLLMETIE